MALRRKQVWLDGFWRADRRYWWDHFPGGGFQCHAADEVTRNNFLRKNLCINNARPSQIVVIF
jgi:hypothetical protein